MLLKVRRISGGVSAGGQSVENSMTVTVGHSQVRRAWVVVCCLGYSHTSTGTLIYYMKHQTYNKT